MHLEQLEQRAALFPQWLEYDMDIRYPKRVYYSSYKYSQEEIMRIFKETGNIYVRHPKDIMPGTYVFPYNFDDWLFQNQHYDLVDYANYPEESLINHVKKGGLSNIVGKMYMDSLALDEIPFKSMWDGVYDGNRLRNYFKPPLHSTVDDKLNWPLVDQRSWNDISDLWK